MQPFGNSRRNRGKAHVYHSVEIGLPLGGRETRRLEGYYEQDAAVDYWTGENTE